MMTRNATKEINKINSKNNRLWKIQKKKVLALKNKFSL